MRQLSRLEIITYYLLLTLLVILVMPIQAIPAAEPTFLNKQEQIWLKQHPIIRFAPDPAFAPVEWFNHVGDYQGMTSDYVRLLQQKLGIKITIIRAQTWKTTINMAKNKQVDVLTAISRTAPREDYLLFSQSYITMQSAIISNQDLPRIRSLSDLKAYKVAVVEGYRWDDTLTAMTEEIAINRFHDLQTALRSTNLGVTDVTIGALDSVRHIQRQEGLVDLKIVSILPQKIKLGFGIRKDWPLLVSILNKGLTRITPAEKTAIQKTWLVVDAPGFWLKPVYRYSILALFVLFLILVPVVISWNRMLKTQVRRRTRELKDAQTLLIQAEKMESIGRLAAGVAHEVKNPLAIIQMGADYLSQEIPADETTSAVIQDINDAIQRADTVIKGLLDFSRDKQLLLKPGNLADIIKHSLHLVSHEMRQRNITVVSEVADDIPEIELDANKLQQVLINLFINSAHAMQHNGKLNVSCYVKTLENKTDLASDHNKYFKLGDTVLWLEVVDNGHGIREQDANLIFDPFYTTKPVGEGTGLGLSVSRNIINLHHGSIDISNHVQGGASVVLMFNLNSGDKK